MTPGDDEAAQEPDYPQRWDGRLRRWITVVPPGPMHVDWDEAAKRRANRKRLKQQKRHERNQHK